MNGKTGTRNPTKNRKTGTRDPSGTLAASYKNRKTETQDLSCILQKPENHEPNNTLRKLKKQDMVP